MPSWSARTPRRTTGAFHRTGSRPDPRCCRRRPAARRCRRQLSGWGWARTRRDQFTGEPHVLVQQVRQSGLLGQLQHGTSPRPTPDSRHRTRRPRAFNRATILPKVPFRIRRRRGLQQTHRCRSKGTLVISYAGQQATRSARIYAKTKSFTAGELVDPPSGFQWDPPSGTTLRGLRYRRSGAAPVRNAHPQAQRHGQRRLARLQAGELQLAGSRPKASRTSMSAIRHGCRLRSSADGIVTTADGAVRASGAYADDGEVPGRARRIRCLRTFTPFSDRPRRPSGAEYYKAFELLRQAIEGDEPSARNRLTLDEGRALIDELIRGPGDG